MDNGDQQLVCYNCESEIDGCDYQEIDNEIYCQSCYDELFCCCDNCNETVSIDNTHCINDACICDDCFDNNYFCCDDCREYNHNDSAINAANGDTICEGCYGENYFTCEGCYEVYHVDCSCDGYCNCCYNQNNSGCLHNYTYKPDPVFYGNEKDNLYFGIELEIESQSNDIDDIVENMNEYMYAKEDSSLDNGFEIVSHPATWDWINSNKNLWNDILRLKDGGFRSYNTDTCGMHVHLSKEAFSSLHLYKFLKMFYENQEFILTISRRRKHNLDRYASLETDESIVYKATKKCNGHTKRYTAVNLENSETIEVRIFRGTLSENGFYRNIEFCKSLFEFTKEASLKDITVSKYCDYVMDNENTYPNLATFLIDKELISTLFSRGQ